MPVSVTERSGNRKLSRTGNVSSTWVAQDSCPDSCELKGKRGASGGCYAEVGRSGLHRHRLNREAARRKKSKSANRLALAKLEAAGIRTLSGTRQLRVHVLGDCATPETAAIVGRAMVEHEAKAGKAAWSYTHSWREGVAQPHWQGARILASCKDVKEVQAARAMGYGTAIIIPPVPSNRAFDYHGERVIPCPAQFGRLGSQIVPLAGRAHDAERILTCELCTLCKRPDMLRDRRLSIGFQPDHGTQRRVLQLLEVK